MVPIYRPFIEAVAKGGRNDLVRLRIKKILNTVGAINTVEAVDYYMRTARRFIRERGPGK